MALSISFMVCYFLLLSANVDAIPNTTFATPSSSELNQLLSSSIIKTLGWETEINICGMDLIKLMTIVCTECKGRDCYIEKSYKKTRSDIIRQATQCCQDYCKLDSMKTFCGFQSFLIDILTVPSTTTKRPKTTTPKRLNQVLGLLPNFPMFGYFPPFF